MSQGDAKRIQVLEGSYTYRNPDLEMVLLEIDSRTTGKDIYTTFTRTSGLISKIEFFSDAAKTQKLFERQYTWMTGSNNIDYLDTITTIFYNEDTSEDSRITTQINRDSDDLITGCDNPFSTSESGIPC